jgi:transcriptional regulator with XRE-family HTH domain
MDAVDAAALIKRARREAGLSQKGLAERAGVQRQTVGLIESGARRPSLGMLKGLLAAAGLQMRVELEPLDADVRREIEARRTNADAAKDVLDVWGSLFGMDEVAYRVEGVAAAALLGAPVPVPVIQIAFAETDATFVWLAAQVRGSLAKVRLDGENWPIDFDLGRDEASREEERARDGVTVRERLAVECPDGRFWYEAWFDALSARLVPTDVVTRHVVVATSEGPIAVQPLDEIEAADGDVARVLRVMREDAAAS